MKILHIINSLNTGGAERLVAEMLPIMRGKGHDVSLLLLGGDGTTPFERQVSESGISMTALNVAGGIYSPLCVAKTAKLIRGYDVVHTHLFPSQYWVALAHAANNDASVLVTTEHNTFNTRARFKVTSMIDRMIYGLYDGIICISPATKDFMVKRVPAGVELRVVENGINLAHCHDAGGRKARAEIMPGLAPDDFVILQVARFHEQKNQDCLIRALRLLPDDVHAVFAGDGVRLDICKRLAADMGVQGRAHFLGSRTDVDALWGVADIGVMSSHWEGFGLAALEGMAHRKPVLGSRVSGLAEVIADDNLLFAPDDDGELARKIQALREDKSMYDKAAERCLSRSAKYSIDNMVDGYVAFYEMLLKRKQNVSK